MARCKIRARLVSLSNCAKMIACLSVVSLISLLLFAANSSSLSDNERTLSTTRPRRVDVERIMLPHAEINTAGVIIAVSTATAEDIGSTLPGSTPPLRSTSLHGGFGSSLLNFCFFRLLWSHMLMHQIHDHLLWEIGAKYYFVTLCSNCQPLQHRLRGRIRYGIGCIPQDA